MQHFSLLAATIDLGAPVSVVAVEQFAAQLVLILRVGSGLRFIVELARGRV